MTNRHEKEVLGAIAALRGSGRSLRAIAQQRGQIQGFEQRFRRLFEEHDWKAKFYELLVAAAYASRGIKTRGNRGGNARHRARTNAASVR